MTFGRKSDETRDEPEDGRPLYVPTKLGRRNVTEKSKNVRRRDPRDLRKEEGGLWRTSSPHKK